MIINAVELDYLTLTTFNPDHYRAMFDALWDLGWEHAQAQGWQHGAAKEARLMQYKGDKINFHPYGSVFIGEGIQKKKKHGLCRCSGFISNKMFGQMEKHLADSLIRTTRIDLQKTIEMPPGYSGMHLHEQLRERGKNTSIIISHGDLGETSTVYIGARSSDRFARVYVKEIKGQRYLRCEFELKGDRASAIAHRIARGTHSLNGVFEYELRRTGNAQLINNFTTGADAKRIKVISLTGLETKEKWFRTQVIPAIESYANNPNHDPDILMHIRNACDVGIDLADELV